MDVEDLNKLLMSIKLVAKKYRPWDNEFAIFSDCEPLSRNECRCCIDGWWYSTDCKNADELWEIMTSSKMFCTIYHLIESDFNLEILNRHTIENPFFNCKSLEEAMIQKDLFEGFPCWHDIQTTF